MANCRSKLSFSAVFFFFVSLAAFGQTDQNARKPSHNISGIVKNSKDNVFADVTVILKFGKDSVVIKTDDEGVFVFNNIGTSVFSLTFRDLRFDTFTKKYLYNEQQKEIILDPVVLGETSHQMSEVKINGTPSIKYKTDTVEYRAADYKVRENATIDEMLMKMEGMEVGKDGSLSHQGRQVVKAKLNGKEFSGGKVDQVIKTLPANIVEKIQIIDDYGVQANRTGDKFGEAKIVLNITTRADRSIGNMASANVGGGNNKRYDNRVFLQRINANETLGLIADMRNTVNGAAPSSVGASGGSSDDTGAKAVEHQSGLYGNGGTTSTLTPAFSFRNSIGNTIDYGVNYFYNRTKIDLVNSSAGRDFSTSGITDRADSVRGSNLLNSHNLSIDVDYNPGKADYFKLQSYFSDLNMERNSRQQLSQNGLINSFYRSDDLETVVNPSYGTTLFYQHLFHNSKQNLSFEVSFSKDDQTTNNSRYGQLKYFEDPAFSNISTDSTIDQSVNRRNSLAVWQEKATYTQPVSEKARFQLSSSIAHTNGANSIATFDNTGSTPVIIDSLTNSFTHKFFAFNNALTFGYTRSRYTLSMGLGATFNRLNVGDRTNADLNNKSLFKLSPVFQMSYKWSDSHSINVNYYIEGKSPEAYQLQPATDYTDPSNPIFGNPNLRPFISQNLRLTYNNYIPNSKVNISLGVKLNKVDDAIAANVLQLTDAKGIYRRETSFLNAGNAYLASMNYNFAKQIADQKVNLEINGNISYKRFPALTNSVIDNTSIWHLNERIGPRISPSENIEINPFMSFDLLTSNSSIPNSINSPVKRTGINLDGRIFFAKSLSVSYDLSKNFYTGLSESNNVNPFVTNLSVEKDVFSRKNGTLSFKIFDLFNQNRFVNRIITPTGYTDTRSNTLSRYFMLSFKIMFQKWGGGPKKNGQPLKRRGDGSFIN
jgi:hypothetical protein